jgi:transcriptional regulator NrdR family protein
MTKVIKRRGTMEDFNPDKIKGTLQKATIDAGYTVDEKKDILDEVYSNITQKLGEKETIDTKTIRGCLLTELDKCEPYIVKSVRRFDRKYKSR